MIGSGYGEAVLVVDEAATIGDFQVGSMDVFTLEGGNAHAIVSAPATITTMGVHGSCTASIQEECVIGAFTVHGDVTFTGTSAGTTVDQFTRLGGDGSVSLDPGADVTVHESSTITTLNIDEALMTLEPRDGELTEVVGHTLFVNNLSLGASGITGVLDLTDGNLIVDYTGDSVLGTWNGTNYTDVTGLLQSGYNEFGWDGNGIVSSEFDKGDGAIRTLGVASTEDALFLTGADTEMWNGFTVDATCVLVKYTYGGDMNLDGVVNGEDYTNIGGNAVLQMPVYYLGDLNYDGLVNGEDYTIIDANYVQVSLIGEIL